MRLLPLLLIALLASGAHAQQVTFYKLSAGTGFVINNDGNVVTNAHVVRGCQSISILTPLGEESAEIVSADTGQDLAVLKTHYISRTIAPMRWNIADLHVGDNVAVIGYPGQLGANGKAQVKKTRVTSLRGPAGDTKWIQLASVAAHGNSGGPVLDMSGNVIGVISGMALTYKVDEHGQPMGPAVGRTDVVITLAALQDFLHEHGIGFYESATGGTAASDGVITQGAHNFIVPVRCVQDIEHRDTPD